MSNPYYNPDELGLKIVVDVTGSNSCYDFDMFVVWQHEETGKFYYASDSGCSCPAPFEDFHELNDLIPADTPDLLHKRLDEETHYGDGDLHYGYTAEDVAEGHRKISELRFAA